ncbi:NAD binding Rossmann fold oxidoreductase [Capsaspora owczarzaki ATCC 30864]|uniref:NAD binding Rossmann fold oxidoreductase n=1 Tax=Capsaspora owczarzaki (strain ATCC 30864) TaxID=595528 RepID=A0A0D2WRC1_CAPO3|nr:NAD binding Rossmann fold oxidoreductase [Capsaspora owczarzaki ATCC 30864]KJE93733.1 NAD binding Rossmann fold oxidoreductase [Capsaspora owczarzaki ATCC 30864]|eukprot:XP_004348311.1 NAD binding Rossmann fold oxidoreductase [Capsaspora owczarzaki ATCC 30864]
MAASSSSRDTINVAMMGTGEYTTGYVHGSQSASDKKIGVVALVLFDLRRLGKIGNLALVGTTGSKFNGIRAHLKSKISDVYGGVDVSCDTYPADDVERDPVAYKKAIDKLQPGDAITIFTPDNTHFEIALYAIQHQVHVLLTKPAVKTLHDHQVLLDEAKKHNVFVMVEFHKRFDPIYHDARERIRTYGDFGLYQSYMSQPKFQLETFRSWAGAGSDISYYLNSHHIDIHCWAMQGIAKPVRLIAMQSNGVAEGKYNCPAGTEDTITLITHWQNIASGTMGVATYVASWSAPKADVHSQQRFFYMGHSGEITVDQAHRNYAVASDQGGFASINPLYMAYYPTAEGHFGGQHGYGYKSLQHFVDGCIAVNKKKTTPEALDRALPTLRATTLVTAILEAGRISLDNSNRAVKFSYADNGEVSSIQLE